MAYEIRPRREEEETRPEGPEGNEGAVKTPASPFAGFAPAAATAAPPATPVNQPDRFVNFDRILAANRDVAVRDADMLATRLKKAGEGVEAGLNQQKADFGSALTGATPEWAANYKLTGKADVAREGGTYKPPESSIPGLQTTGQGLQGTPQKGVPPNLAQARDYTKEEWAGPQGLYSLPGWEKFARGAVRTQDELAKTGTAAGLQALATQAGATPEQAQFDTALMQSLGTGQFDQLRNRFSGLDKAITDAIGTSQKQSGEAEADFAKAKAAYTQGADSVESAMAETDARRAAEAADRAIIAQLSKEYDGERGQWGQVDVGGKSDGRLFHNALVNASGAGGYFDMMNLKGLERTSNIPNLANWSEDQMKSFYNKLSDDEVRELRAISELNERHPYVAAALSGTGNKNMAQTQALGKWLDRVYGKYYGGTK